MTAIYTFGPFRLDVAAGILFRGAEPVALGRRAVALLHVLVEGAGTPISKDRLIERRLAGAFDRGKQLNSPDCGVATDLCGRTRRRKLDRDTASPRLPLYRTGRR